MANTATELYTSSPIPARPGKNGPIRCFNIAIDTTGQDLTIITPTTGQRIFVVGMFFAETNACNVTWKSGSTTIVVPEFAANQAVYDKVMDGFIFATNKDEALIIQSSAAISSMLLHVVDAKYY